MFTSSRKRKKLPIPFRPRLEILEDRTLLSVCMVDRLTDTGEGSKLAGDLRYCITQAADGDSIQFGVQGTINLTGALPDLTHSISIEGPGANLLTVRRDTGGNYRIFTVAGSPDLAISGLTITNGLPYLSKGNVEGGGLYVAGGSLTLADSVVANNHAIGQYGFGGGLFVAGGTVVMSNSTISNNTAEGHADAGGAVYNAGTLTIINSTISANRAFIGEHQGGSGGGIYNAGILAVSHSSFLGNIADGNLGGGGGISNVGTTTVSNSTISDNSALSGGGIANGGTVTVSYTAISGNFQGGGIYNFGAMTLSYSTINGNHATNEGGGICNLDRGTVSNSIISGNSAGVGGGIYNGDIGRSGTMTVSNSTITANMAIDRQTAGGIAAAATVILLNSTVSNNTVTSTDRTGSQLFTQFDNVSIQIRNTIISSDGSRPNLFADTGGTFISQGDNLSSDDGSGFLTGAGDLTNADPLLGPLQDNGGPTLTMVLMPHSPALNAGDPDQLGSTDQRGVVRSRGVNIGAYQASPSAFLLSAPDTVEAGVPFDVTVTVADPFGQASVGYTGTVTFSTTDAGKGVVLPADYTFTPDDSGYHIFTDTGLGETTLITQGDQTVTVKDTKDESITGSATVTVTGGDFPHGSSGWVFTFLVGAKKTKDFQD